MTTYSWTGGSDDWSTQTGWTPVGPPDASTADVVIAPPGNDTITISTGESFLIDSLTFDPASSTTLALNGTLTLGGTLAAMAMSSGTLDIGGMLAGGTLTMNGGLLGSTGNGVISSAFLFNGGTMAIAGGNTLTLTGVTTWDDGARIVGPGTLLTTGTTNVDETFFPDGSLVWDNSGTVMTGAGILAGYPSGSGTVTIDNLAGGVFDLTADNQGLNAYGGASLLLENAGTLAKTGGTGTSNIYAAVTNTGTITATTGTLELNSGGTLGGTVIETGTGAVALGAGLFAPSTPP
jgi:fibronectin-binding autotransporter adhesin